MSNLERLIEMFVAYLRQQTAGLSVSEREMFRHTRAYDYGAGQSAKAVAKLVSKGRVQRQQIGSKWYVRLAE